MSELQSSLNETLKSTEVCPLVKLVLFDVIGLEVDALEAETALQQALDVLREVRQAA